MVLQTKIAVRMDNGITWRSKGRSALLRFTLDLTWESKELDDIAARQSGAHYREDA